MTNTTTEQPTPKYRSDYTTPSHSIAAVELEFVLGEAETLVRCRAQYKQAGESNELRLHGEGLDLREIAIDGQALEAGQWRIEDEDLIIPAFPAEAELQTLVAIKPQDNTELSGLYKSSGNFCTQCEAEGFRRITYFLDRPDVMTVYKTTITADKSLYPMLLSNGNRIASEDLPDGRHTVTWEDPFPKPSYLFALVAGDLHCHAGSFTTASGREVRLEILVEHQDADKCDHALLSLQKSMQWDEDVFGLEYDLDIYMLVAVSDFNMGAMENKGLNIFNSKYVLARPDTATDDDYEGIEGVIAHEYFHNWTGNRVTCRDWFQLTLKEGLTVYRDQRFTADMTSHAVKRIDDVCILRAAQFPEDAGPMRHPIRPESYIVMDNFYTATVYNKGAEVIRMYATLLGEDGFRAGMDLYFKRHDGQAVTCDDFRMAMADANERDLSQFENWYTTPGTPQLSASWERDEQAASWTLTLTQALPQGIAEADFKALHMPVRIALIGADSGQALNCTINGTTASDHVLELTALQQAFTFTDVNEAVIPSLLRDFSAPVSLEAPLSKDDLLFLLGHDTDPFNRWEAGQRYAEQLIVAMMQSDSADAAAALIPAAFTEAIAATLASDDLDDALKAQALVLPSERILAQKVDIVDPDAIHQAREQLRQHLATALRAQWQAAYDERNGQAWELTKASNAARRLKNVCLAYLCAGDHAEGIALAVQHQQQADNMTDSQAALGLLAASQRDEAKARVQAFADQWQADALVMDKWFTVQAIADRSDSVEHVQSLLDHPDFTLSNPNRVRSLIGAFAMANQAHFHRKDGAGYALVGDQVAKLSSKNPQLAARLVSTFNQWRRYDADRRALMQAQLTRINELPDCSRDVREIVQRALQES